MWVLCRGLWLRLHAWGGACAWRVEWFMDGFICSLGWYTGEDCMTDLGFAAEEFSLLPFSVTLD